MAEDTRDTHCLLQDYRYALSRKKVSVDILDAAAGREEQAGSGGCGGGRNTP